MLEERPLVGWSDVANSTKSGNHKKEQEVIIVWTRSLPDISVVFSLRAFSAMRYSRGTPIIVPL